MGDVFYDRKIKRACRQSERSRYEGIGLYGGRNWEDKVIAAVDNRNKHIGDMQADAVRILGGMP